MDRTVLSFFKTKQNKGPIHVVHNDEKLLSTILVIWPAFLFLHNLITLIILGEWFKCKFRQCDASSITYCHPFRAQIFNLHFFFSNTLSVYVSHDAKHLNINTIIKIRLQLVWSDKNIINPSLGFPCDSSKKLNLLKHDYRELNYFILM